MPGRGRASGTSPGSRRRHQRPPSADPPTTSGLTSQFTWKVPSARRGQDLRQALFSQAKGTLICKRSRSADHWRKPEASARGALDPSTVRVDSIPSRCVMEKARGERAPSRTGVYAWPAGPLLRARRMLQVLCRPSACLSGACPRRLDSYLGGNWELGAGDARLAVGALAVNPRTAQLMSTPTEP